MLKVLKKSNKSYARLARLKTPHGEIDGPFFMTIATAGAVKTLDTEKMRRLSAPILLANTYHLYLRPGTDLIQKAGGLHRFMNWDKPILTDSGGYQVFSLAKMREIQEKGVFFQSHLDGSRHLLSPEKSIEVQLKLGSDILMVLDECAPQTETRDYIQKSLELTTRWAKRSKVYFDANHEFFRYAGLGKPLCFGIIQGGSHLDLRVQSLNQITEIPFDGFAIGGVSVGEPQEETRAVIEHIAPRMPEDKPRYVMGVGFPEELVFGVKQGVDMFDCVIPTRHARHGSLFVFQDRDQIGKGDFYKKVNIKNEEHKESFEPLDLNCACLVCQNYSKAYLRYLFHIGEMLGFRLATIHNVFFYLELMDLIREKIKRDEF